MSSLLWARSAFHLSQGWPVDESPEARLYFDAKQLSQRCGLSITTIWRLKHAGKIPFYQPTGKNGRVLFPSDAIEQAAGDTPTPTPNDALSEELSGPRPRWMSSSGLRKPT